MAALLELELVACTIGVAVGIAAARLLLVVVDHVEELLSRRWP